MGHPLFSHPGAVALNEVVRDVLLKDNTERVKALHEGVQAREEVHLESAARLVGVVLAMVARAITRDELSAVHLVSTRSFSKRAQGYAITLLEDMEDAFEETTVPDSWAIRPDMFLVCYTHLRHASTAHGCGGCGGCGERGESKPKGVLH